MSRSVRYIVLALVAVVVIAAVTGIAFWTAGNDPSNPDPGLYIDGKKVDEPGVALTVGTHEVSFADYRHYYLVTKSSMEMYYGETIWDDDPDGEKALVMRDAVETELVTLFAWLDIAEEKGIELSQEDLDEIDATLAEQKETYGATFDQQLASMYFDTEEDYLRITKLQKLSEKAQTAVNDELRTELASSIGAEADKEYDDAYITAKHILIKFAEDETDTAKAEADALEKIEGILAEIRASEEPAETFDTLMWEYTEDMDGLEANPDGYTFKEGDMVEEFYQTALDTAVGDISEPVKSTYGYHIILRLPLSDAQKETNRDTEVNTAVTEKSTELLDAKKQELTVTGGSYYEDIVPTGII